MLLNAWLLAAGLGAQADSVVYKKPNEIRIAIQRAAKGPVIDGRLDAEVWKLARPSLGCAVRTNSRARSARA